MKRIKAYIRLAQMKERNKDLESFANSIFRALHRKDLNDFERSKVLEMVNIKMEQELARKKELKHNDFIITEMAHDNLKLINLKYN